MLDDLHVATFAAHVHTAFRIDLSSAQAITLKLVEVKDGASSDERPSTAAAVQERFSIMFRSPHDRLLQQGMYRIQHDHLGAFELFLVPVGLDGDGLYYEAVFNRVRRGMGEDRLATLGWSSAQQDAFLRIQFTAQQRCYLAQFPAADFQVILWHGRPIGRLYLERRVDEIRGVDIALLPAYRQAGIGTALLQVLLAEAAGAGKPFRLHVAKFNRARRLYERLGFITLEDDGVYLFMEWSPDKHPLTGRLVSHHRTDLPSAPARYITTTYSN